MALSMKKMTNAAALAALHAITLPPGWSEASFAALLRQPEVRLETITNETLCAFLLWRAAGGEAEILTFCTHPTHRRKGYAHNLLHTMLNRASNIAKTVFLEVAVDNLAAITLYEKQGFRRIGHRPAYFTTPQGLKDAIVMRCELP